ncbi:MAG: oxidoreductase [Halieaceae bacterium]
MRVLLAGGTGLVGNEVIELADNASVELVGIGRRATGKLTEEIITALKDIPPLPAADAAICTLGTTLRSAGSRAAFRAVDYEAVMAFARAAKATGAAHFIAVTAVGANPGSSVFYSRVKGEVERDLSALGFARLDIVRPGLLLGNRSERRPIESFLQAVAPVTDSLMLGPWRRYRSVSAGDVARYLLALTAYSAPGVFTHHFEEITTGRAGNRAGVT